MTHAPEDLTEMLEQWSSGNREGLDRLIPIIYDELRRIAKRHFRRERPDNTLQPTALVSELYIRLVDQKRVRLESRAHLLAIAARIMRQVMVDRARARNTAKRGGGDYKLDLTEAGDLPDESQRLDILALDLALDKLASFDPQQSHIVELKFFGGLSIEETGEVMEISVATVKREWALARSWLLRELSK
jgi:RNA polymerase sigma factor (TIGR02999 family)